MILGDVCTRNCSYCAVAHGSPAAPDPGEPARLAEAVASMELAHVVITSVDRDDLPNGGAETFADCVQAIRDRLPSPSPTIEVLVPDFQGSERALGIVLQSRPDILNHNLETCDRLYRLARPGGAYRRALSLLAAAKGRVPELPTKSGLMLGLGEEWDEIVTCLRDLRRSEVDILTLGQYLRPSSAHLPVARYYSPAEFTELADLARSLGFLHVQASPLTRSSYHAWDQAREAGVGQAEKAVGSRQSAVVATAHCPLPTAPTGS
jgi:lipoic acid synthetase